MLDIIGKRFWLLLISAALTLICIILLATFGLKLGIDFSSGSILTATGRSAACQVLSAMGPVASSP